MGRLIDENELIDIIQGSDELLDFQKNECINCIKACDTAYDPDKVVEQLEAYSNADEAEQAGTIPVIELEDAIKIVKAGGVDAN